MVEDLLLMLSYVGFSVLSLIKFTCDESYKYFLRFVFYNSVLSIIIFHRLSLVIFV